MTTLRQRIADALGWSFEDTLCFSLPSLRELVRPKSNKLADEITQLVKSGEILIGERR